MPSCGSCGFDNREAAEFCGGCGGSLATAVLCVACGSENASGQRFCDECGASLGASGPPASPKPSAAAAAEPESLAGGRYQLLRYLGEGAKKRVHLARDTRLDREVAIAFVKSDGLDLVRVRRETEAMGRLGDHPHIVTVHDVAEEDDCVYLVCQYMAGGDLEHRLDEAEGRWSRRDSASAQSARWR